MAHPLHRSYRPSHKAHPPRPMLSRSTTDDLDERAQICLASSHVACRASCNQYRVGLLSHAPMPTPATENRVEQKQRPHQHHQISGLTVIRYSERPHDDAEHIQKYIQHPLLLITTHHQEGCGNRKDIRRGIDEWRVLVRVQPKNPAKGKCAQYTAEGNPDPDRPA